jgi:hypothetical protein
MSARFGQNAANHNQCHATQYVTSETRLGQFVIKSFCINDYDEPIMVYNYGRLPAWKSCKIAR